MIGRFFGVIGIGALMLVTSFGVYTYLGAHQSKLAAPPQKPTHSGSVRHTLVLPGTLYLEQSGALYSLTFGQFTQLTPEQGWMQPSLIPGGGGLLAVKRELNYSDVYSLSVAGVPQSQLTSNIKPSYSYDIGDNHWSFYPRLTADGNTLFMTYDEPKYGYQVDMSIWSMPYPVATQTCVTSRSCRLWTYHSNNTGGDVQALPLPSGGVIFTEYDYVDQKVTASLVLTPRAGAQGTVLSQPESDCSEAALSPDGTQLAMICSGEKQVSNLYIASFDGSALGPLQQVTNGQLVAQPIWAPDGSGIAYLAPAVPDGPFQLWWLGKDAYTPPPPPSPSPIETPSPSPTAGGHHTPSPSPRPSPSPEPVKPIQVTIDLGFDATSPIAWSI